MKHEPKPTMTPLGFHTKFSIIQVPNSEEEGREMNITPYANG